MSYTLRLQERDTSHRSRDFFIAGLIVGTLVSLVGNTLLKKLKKKMVKPNKRLAFAMEILPHRHEMFMRRYSAVWGELCAAFKLHGVHNYSVYASEDVPTAFVYLEVESEKQWAELQTLPVMKRWLSLSAQQVKADKDGEAVMHRLSELFHLE